MAAQKRRRKQQSMELELPHEIIEEEILLRLPVKSLVRFRCVCKSWQSLITSQHFIRMHLNHQKSNNHHQKFILPSFFSAHFLHYGPSNNNGKVELVEFPLEHLQKKSFRFIGSCDGFICIVVNNTTLVIWNPSIREYTNLPISSGSAKDIIGIGYDSTIDDYKVVRVCNCKAKGDITPVQIYTFKTNSWRKILLNAYYERDGMEPGKFFNGALYWKVTHITHEGHDGNYTRTVLRFDLADEKFTVVPLPTDLAKVLEFNMKVLGNWLCIVRNHLGGHVEIWALKEENNNMKQIWSKMITIWQQQSDIMHLNPICFRNMGEILMSSSQGNCYASKFCLYNPKEAKVKKVLISNNEHCFWEHETIYTESLLSSKGLEVQSSKKRRQLASSVTNHRY